ncbi:MAG: hypothetical protein HZY73_08135 [Micropruina sp.]|nr:MAG: hypothetical protein HZY73_08135 [Micropruina sp.]
MTRGRRPDPRCPLRPTDPCTLCQLDVTGPHDCPLVMLALDDPELQADWERRRAERGDGAARSAGRATQEGR